MNYHKQQQIVDHNLKVLKNQLVQSIKHAIDNGETKQQILKTIFEDEQCLQNNTNPDFLNETIDMVNSIFAIHKIE